MESEKCPDGHKSVRINKKQISVRDDSLTGEEILKLADLRVTEYDLFLINDQKSEKIEEIKPCKIQEGQQFNAILKSVPYG